MMRVSFLLLLTSCLFGSALAQFDRYCCMCDGCYGVDTTKYDFMVESDQFALVSCVELDYKMTTQLDPGATCTAEIARHKRCCCTAETNGCNSLERPPSNPPQVNYPQGSHPYCDLCRNGQYPNEPYTIAAIAYMPGNPSCADLYWMGRTNNIPAALCYPIQSFMETPCGCLPEAPAPTPTPPAPTPTPPAVSIPKVPQRTWKEDYKIGVIGRARGVTNSANVRGLKEEDA